LGIALKDAVNRQIEVRHPLYPEIDEVAYVMFRNRVGDDLYQTCMTLPPGRVDRSPCGTGSSANLATFAARGLVHSGSWLTSRSTIGGEFKIDCLGETEVGGKRAVLPRLHGRAWLYGIQEQAMNRDDPLSA
jgi:proline racemase